MAMWLCGYLCGYVWGGGVSISQEGGVGDGSVGGWGWGGGWVGGREGRCDVTTPKPPPPPRHTCDVQEWKKQFPYENHRITYWKTYGHRWAIFMVNVRKRCAQKLRRFFLLQFELLTFRFAFGGNQTTQFSWFLDFGDPQGPLFVDLNENKRATLLVKKPPEATAKTTRRASLILMSFQKFTFMLCFNIWWWLSGACREIRRSSKGNRRPFGGSLLGNCSASIWL